ncbi:iron-containing alcohol dehydrogenase [Maricurvus nonylphenolicus]|uniref:iron-containing alcohol dehydrogenase n=1 Tax=Maricurvus nonylphenolicus TaxID=1008307 RepID=UPI0036F36503
MRQTQATLAEKLRFKVHGIELKAMGQFMKLMKMRDTDVFVGSNAVASLADKIAQAKRQKVLIVTTAGAVKRGQIQSLIDALTAKDIGSAVYDGIIPDPTYETVRQGLKAQQQHSCDCVVAFGGGSAMDAAKAIVIAATNEKPVEKLIGIRKGKNKPLPLYAVPTTSGTASEVTPAAVISEDHTHTKRFIIDSRTIAHAAALDPTLSASLPASITAETGMDALTHAIEAYLSKLGTAETDAHALDAITTIFKHLPIVVEDGGNLESREAMAKASLIAGKAFRKAPLGYVHAISHQLGAIYGTPHGLGNAILLPLVVEYSKDAITEKLAELAKALNLSSANQSEEVLANLVVDALKELNQRIHIPAKAEALKAEDLPTIAKRAYAEALDIHAAPKYMGKKDIVSLLEKLL